MRISKKITKKTKIIFLLGSSVVLFSTTAVFANGNNFSFATFNIPKTEFSSSLPSSINKDTSNINSFYSPVTNIEKQEQPIVKKEEPLQPIKTETPPVVQEDKPPVPIKKEESVQLETTPIVKQEIPKPVEKPIEKPTPKPIERPATSSSKLITGAELERRIAIGLQNYKQALLNDIKDYENRIKTAEAYIKDQLNVAVYGELAVRRTQEDIEFIYIKNTLERDKAYLKYLKSLPAKTSFTAEEIKSLQRGLVPSTDTISAWDFLNKEDNQVVQNQIQANKRRFFANSSEWQRTDINSLNYPGWTRSNVSSQFSSINSNLIGVGKPIEFLSYSPSDSEFKSKGDSIIAVLDANSEQAFQEFSSIISQATQQNVKIKGVVLKNVGSKNSLQNVEQILQKLPTQIVKLTLFLENYRATEGLRGLENHKLQELELYSNSNSVNSNWGINPNSLKNVDYISFDYHNQATYGAGVRVAGSIVFNTLRWDKNDEIQQVNEGLEIAFGSKINQRVFQGTSGGKGGHPVNLDFSSTPKIKSLKGVDFNKINQLFNDKIKNWEGDKFAQEDFQARNVKFKQLYFAPTQKNGQQVYEANISDFENGQFSTALSWDEPTQPQIYIGTPGNTLVNPTFYLNGKASDLKGNAKSELEWFVRAVGARGSFAKIVVSDPALKSALGGAISGVLVTQESDSAIGSSGNEIVA